MLYRIAHKLYQSEFIKDGKMYHRYVSDFLNSHTYTDCMDAAGKNEHKKNYHIMEELLTVRKDLVHKFFGREYLDDSDYFVIHHEFNTTEPLSSSGVSVNSGTLSGVCIPKYEFQCYFNSAQIDIIKLCINEVQLFSTKVSETEVKELFACCLKHPLKSACNRRVAFFFDALCEYKLISPHWQHIIDKNGLILSSTKAALLNSSKLSTALSEVKQNAGCVYRTIKLWVKEVADNG